MWVVFVATYLGAVDNSGGSGFVNIIDAYDERVCVSELGYVEDVGGEGDVSYILAAFFGAKGGDGEVKEGWEAFYCY